ncbi:hypothetical protein T12_1195, partial [Trichinella patagoniensis]
MMSTPTIAADVAGPDLVARPYKKRGRGPRTENAGTRPD